MINKTNIKYYLIPGIVLFILFLIVLIVPLENKKEKTSITPTQATTATVVATVYPTNKVPTLSIVPSSNPLNGPTPTLVPPNAFTGANPTLDIPSDVVLFSQQKMELRRKTPLTLPFGTISFDYATDIFTLSLLEPKNGSQTAFTAWLKQHYPAITIDQFAIQ